MVDDWIGAAGGTEGQQASQGARATLATIRMLLVSARAIARFAPWPDMIERYLQMLLAVRLLLAPLQLNPGVAPIVS